MPRSSFLHLVAALLSLLLTVGSTVSKGSGFNFKNFANEYKAVLAANNAGVSTKDGMVYTVQITLGWESELCE